MQLVEVAFLSSFVSSSLIPLCLISGKRAAKQGDAPKYSRQREGNRNSPLPRKHDGEDLFLQSGPVPLPDEQRGGRRMTLQEVGEWGLLPKANFPHDLSRGSALRSLFRWSAFPLLFSALPAQIYWQSLDEAFQRARYQDRLLLIYVYTPWCSPCVMMDQNVWNHPLIASYATANFHCARLDAEARDSIPFNGTYFPYLPELHANQLAYLLLEGNMQYPALVLMAPSGEVLLVLRGYLKPALVDTLLHYFATRSYQHIRWEDYQKEYQSQL